MRRASGARRHSFNTAASRDEASGETALKPVTALIRPHERVIWTVTFEVGDAEEVFLKKLLADSNEGVRRSAEAAAAGLRSN